MAPSWIDRHKPAPPLFAEEATTGHLSLHSTRLFEIVVTTHEKPKANALVIVVNYGSPHSSIQLLHRLAILGYFDRLQVRIVDNRSSHNSIDGITEASANYSNVCVLKSEINRGYFGAARFALDMYLSLEPVFPDWTIVCNHDVLIEEKDFFTKLFQLDPSSVGVVAPRIQNMSGNADQNPFMSTRPGKLTLAKLQTVSSNYPVAVTWDWLWRRKLFVKSWLTAQRLSAKTAEAGTPRVIYAPHGSFLIFSRKYFSAGGFLDSNLFLYGEELSVAEICRSLNLPIVYEPSLRVIHKEHLSTGKTLSRFTFECQRKAIQYISARYFSNSSIPIRSCQPDLR